MTTDEIRTALLDRNLVKVAENTGLHHNTLVALRKGTVAKPNPGTIEILRRYLGGE